MSMPLTTAGQICGGTFTSTVGPNTCAPGSGAWLQLLPAYRWNTATGLNTSVSSGISLTSFNMGHLMSFILDGLANIGFIIAKFMWQLILWIVRLLTDTSQNSVGLGNSSISYKVNHVYHQLFQPLQSSGLLYGVLVCLGIYALYRALRGNHRHMVTIFMRTFIILGAILWMANGAAQATPNAAPPSGSPAWLMGKVQSDINLVGTGVLQLTQGFNTNSNSQYCDAYAYNLNEAAATIATNAPSTPGPSGTGLGTASAFNGGLDAETVSAVWQDSYLPIWEDAQFGSSSNETGGTSAPNPNPNPASLAYCHYLDGGIGATPTAQYIIFTNAEGPQYQGVTTNSNLAYNQNGSTVNYNMSPAIGTVTTNNGWAIPPPSVTFNGQTGQQAVYAMGDGQSSSGSMMSSYESSIPGGVFGPGNDSNVQSTDRSMFAWAMCVPSSKNNAWTVNSSTSPISLANQFGFTGSTVDAYCGDWYANGDGLYASTQTGSDYGNTYQFEEQANNQAGGNICDGSKIVSGNAYNPSYCATSIKNSNTWQTAVNNPNSSSGVSAPPIWVASGNGQPLLSGSTNGFGWANPFAMFTSDSVIQSHAPGPAGDFFNAWVGYNSTARVIDSGAATITSSLYLFSMGGMSLGVLFAMIGVDVFSMFLLFILLAMLMSPSPTRGITGRVIKIGVSLMGAQFMFALLYSILLAVISLIDTTLPGGSGIASIMLKAVAPIGALFLVNMLAKAIFNMPSILNPLSIMRVGMALSGAMDKMQLGQMRRAALSGAGPGAMGPGAMGPGLGGSAFGNGGLGTGSRLGPTGGAPGGGAIGPGGYPGGPPGIGPGGGGRQGAALAGRAKGGLLGKGMKGMDWVSKGVLGAYGSAGSKARAGLARGTGWAREKFPTPFSKLSAAKKSMLDSKLGARTAAIAGKIGAHPIAQKAKSIASRTGAAATVGALGMISAPLGAAAAIPWLGAKAWESYRSGTLGKAVSVAHQGAQRAKNAASWYFDAPRQWGIPDPKRVAEARAGFGQAPDMAALYNQMGGDRQEAPAALPLPGGGGPSAQPPPPPPPPPSSSPSTPTPGVILPTVTDRPRRVRETVRYDT